MRCYCCTLCAAHWTLCAVTAHYVLLTEHYVLLLRNISCSCRCLLISLREASYIGWLKNFITDRNHATQNLIDSYVAATLVRRAPPAIKTSLLARWTQVEIASANRTFLQSADQILGRSRGRAGMHEVHMPTLARHNARLVEQPSSAVRQWFATVERGLEIRVFNSRGCIRKNGHRVVPGNHVSYYEGTALRIGVLLSTYVGSHPSAPLDPICAVCVVRRYRSSQIRRSDNFRDGGMLILSLTGVGGQLDCVCSTLLQHLYVRAIWECPGEEELFALVRMEAL